MLLSRRATSIIYWCFDLLLIWSLRSRLSKKQHSGIHKYQSQDPRHGRDPRHPMKIGMFFDNWNIEDESDSTIYGGKFQNPSPWNGIAGPWRCRFFHDVLMESMTSQLQVEFNLIRDKPTNAQGFTEINVVYLADNRDKSFQTTMRTWLGIRSCFTTGSNV